MSWIETFSEPNRIKSVFPVTNSLFSHMDYDFKYMSNANLDTLYYLEYSQRLVSPVIESFITESSPLPDSSLQQIADLILGLYKQKWDKLIDLYTLEYDPIHNFSDDFTESKTNTETRDLLDRTQEQGTTTNTGTQTNVRTDNLSSSTTDKTIELSISQLLSSVLQTRTPELETLRTDNLTRTTDNQKSTTTKRSPSLEELETRNLSDGNTRNVADNIYGFNSSTAGGKDTSLVTDSGTNTGTIKRETTGGDSTTVSYSGNPDTVKDTGTQTTTNTGTEKIHTLGAQNDTSNTDTSYTSTTSDTGTQTNKRTDELQGTSQNQSSITRTGTDVNEMDRHYTRIGNIGNITTQQMIREEVELWQWNFIQSVLEDVRDFTSLSIY